jgi:integrase/recombinase XerD
MTNKGRRFPPEPLTADEVRRLAAAANARYPTGSRNRALLRVAASTGARISELLAVKVADYDPERGQLRLLRGKGGKSRVVGVPVATHRAIEKWMRHRGRLGLPRRGPLFSTLRGEPLESSYCRAMIKRLGKRAGIEKRVHFHGLRHTLAVALVREGVPVNAVSMTLGHSSSSTTARYIDHLAPEQTIAVVAPAAARWAEEIGA